MLLKIENGIKLSYIIGEYYFPFYLILMNLF